MALSNEQVTKLNGMCPASKDAGIGSALAQVQADVVTAQTTANAAMSVQKRTVTIAFGDWAALAAATTHAVDVGLILPANSRIVGHEVVMTTPFNSGGTNPDIAVDVGVKAGDTDAVIAAKNISHDGTSGTTPGVQGYSMAKLGAVTLLATVTSAATPLANYSAGAMTINVFVIPIA